MSTPSKTKPKLLIFSARRPDLSLEQYKAHYDNNHVPLLREILGDAFPITHERNYIPRLADGSTHLLLGEGDIEFDCITECLFADEEHLGRAVAALNTPGLKERREEDEARFLDGSKTKIVLVESSASS